MSSCIWFPGKIHTRPWGHYLSTGPLSHDKRWLYMRGDIITPLSVQRWPLLSDVNGLFPLSLDVHQLLIDYLDPFTVDAVTSRTCFQSLYPESVWCHTPPQCFSQGGGFCLEDVQADLMPELPTYTVPDHLSSHDRILTLGHVMTPQQLPFAEEGLGTWTKAFGIAE